jgi:hypothetical protein
MHYFMCLLLYSRISWNAYCTFQYLNTKEVFASFFFLKNMRFHFFISELTVTMENSRKWKGLRRDYLNMGNK